MENGAKEDGSWACQACTFVNSNPTGLSCEVCWSKRRGPVPSSRPAATVVTLLPPPQDLNKSKDGDCTDSTDSHTLDSDSTGSQPSAVGFGLGDADAPLSPPKRKSKRRSSQRCYQDTLVDEAPGNTNVSSNVSSNGAKSSSDSLQTATTHAQAAEYSYFHSIQQETLRRSHAAHVAKTNAQNKTLSLSTFAQSTSNILLDPKTLQSLLAKQEYYDKVAVGDQDAPFSNNPGNGHDNDDQDDLLHQEIARKLEEDDHFDEEAITKAFYAAKKDRMRKNAAASSSSCTSVPYSFRIAFLIALALLAWFSAKPAQSNIAVITYHHDNGHNVSRDALLMEDLEDTHIGLYGFSTHETQSELSPSKKSFLYYTMQQESFFVTFILQLARLWFSHIARSAAAFIVLPMIFVCAVIAVSSSKHQHQSPSSRRRPQTNAKRVLTVLTALLALGPWLCLTAVFRSPLCNSHHPIQLNYQSIITNVEMNLGYDEDDDDSIDRTMHVFYATTANYVDEAQPAFTASCHATSGAHWIIACSLLWFMVFLGVRFWLFTPTATTAAAAERDDNDAQGENAHLYAAHGLEPLWQRPKFLLNGMTVASIITFLLCMPTYWIRKGYLVNTGTVDERTITQIFGWNRMNPVRQNIVYSEEQRQIIQHEVFGPHVRTWAWLPAALIAVCVLYLLKAQYVMWYQHYKEQLAQQQRERQQTNKLLSVWFYPVARNIDFGDDENDDSSNDVTSPFLHTVSSRWLRLISVLSFVAGLWIASTAVVIHMRATSSGLCSRTDFPEFQFVEALDFDDNATQVAYGLTNQTDLLFFAFDSEDAVPSSFWRGTDIVGHPTAHAVSCHLTQYAIFWIVGAVLAMMMGMLGCYVDHEIRQAHDTFAALYPGVMKTSASRCGNCFQTCGDVVSTICLPTVPFVDHDVSAQQQEEMAGLNSCPPGGFHRKASKRNSAEINREPINIVI